MQVNIIITNRDFPKVVFKKKTVILDCYIKEDLLQDNYYRWTRLVTRGTWKTCLVTHSTRLTTRSTRLSFRSTRLSTRNFVFSTRSTCPVICLSIRSTPLSTRSIRLSTCSICLSTHCTQSSICQSTADLCSQPILIFQFVNVSYFSLSMESLNFKKSKACSTEACFLLKATFKCVCIQMFLTRYLLLEISEYKNTEYLTSTI